MSLFAQKVPAWLLRWLDAVFGMDVRALAVTRIGLGLLLLIDTIDRTRDLATFYTDGGVLPIADTSPSRWHFSLHLLSGSAEVQAVLFALAGLAAVGVILGWRTRLSLLVAWALLLSVQARNPLVLYGGDVVMRLMCFWGLFLPLGAMWSLDRRAGRVAPPPTRLLSIGTAGWVMQIAWIYIVTVVLKSGADWHNGMAVWYALQLEHYTDAFGTWLLNFPTMLWATTWFVFALEALGPALLLVPVARLRTVVCALFIGMHLGFEACMEIGLFPWVSALSWVPLLPSWVWDRLRLPTQPGAAWRPSVLNQLLAAAALVYVACWNLGTIAPKHIGVRGDWRIPASVLRLDQNWNMFAPKPLRDDGWFVIIGERADGGRVDLWQGGQPVSLEKPARVSAMYKNERWRKYMRNLWYKKNKKHRPAFLGWLCEQWNAGAAPEAVITSIEMNYMQENSVPPGETAAAEKVLMRTWTCEAP